MSISKSTENGEQNAASRAFTTQLYHAVTVLQQEQEKTKPGMKANGVNGGEVQTPPNEPEVTGVALYKSVPQAPDRLTSQIPPINFGAVIPGQVYRSSFPLPENFSFLKTLKLKTILTLVPQPFPESYLEFMKHNGILQVVIPIPANKDVICMDAHTIMKALGIILDRTNYPLLIHCNKGKHRTGCVVSCFRKVQGEHLTTCLNEYHTYAGSKARPLDVDFITGFDDRPFLWLARENSLVQEDETLLDSPAWISGNLITNS